MAFETGSVMDMGTRVDDSSAFSVAGSVMMQLALRADKIQRHLERNAI